MNALALAALLLGGMDWSQTRTMATVPAACCEANPILGQHPTVGQVNGYFVGATVVTAGVALALRPGPRRWWLRAVVAVELVNVVRNRALGVGFTF